jgi:Post-segregation antitoxin CcdA
METPKIAKDKTEKQKLTLGIDRGIIDRAKAAGINISAITEHLLRSITYDPKGDTTETVVKAIKNKLTFKKLSYAKLRKPTRYNN